MSEYIRIKAAVEDQKKRKAQGEAKQQSLIGEASRIVTTIEQDTGKSLPDAAIDLSKAVQEGEQLLKNTEQEISTQVLELKAILEKEGVAY